MNLQEIYWNECEALEALLDLRWQSDCLDLLLLEYWVHSMDMVAFCRAAESNNPAVVEIASAVEEEVLEEALAYMAHTLPPQLKIKRKAKIDIQIKPQ